MPENSNRIGTFIVSDVIWENQSEEIRERFWTRILKVTWDEKRYWITAESILFDPIKDGEVIPDYAIEIRRRGRGHRDSVRAIRQKMEA